MIPQLGIDPGSPFPDPDKALDAPDGLLAWGGDLDPVRLVNAYRNGIFPWYSGEQPILWWNPSMRCIIRPGDVYVSRRLARVLRSDRFRISVDTAFSEVISACALPRKDQDGTWITPRMIQAYTRLHGMGIAHSIEVWSGDRLAGGLYGLAIGRMFFGESMFSAVSEASKVALVILCRQMQAWGFPLLDCQVCNPHLERMGAVEIAREAFLGILNAHVDLPGVPGPWSDRFELTGAPT
ncbi:MAG: leucyl/phenylalanyl-tRNA--protein transferase [Xanthomonadales bacterium]|nr:leucyl/phenylalanyl-tRNA--protein transferase [Xanthomonadales bacterium]NIX14226.1 leucyl/phenylalanyl-tRNA--protein transferase [Xanthomonadales bacterium]